jgi:hypothetical protein
LAKGGVIRLRQRLGVNFLAASVQPDAMALAHSKPNGDFVGRPLAGVFLERAQVRG